MSPWDRIFMGKVIKDFGTLEEESFIIGKVRKSLLLVYLPPLLQFIGEIQGVANQRNSTQI